MKAHNTPVASGIRLLLLLLASGLISSVLSQTSSLDLSNPLGAPARTFDAGRFVFPDTTDAAGAPSGDNTADSSQSEQQGLVRRSVRRVLRDQKELYLAPFHRSNLKWDALLLAGTGL